MAVKAQPTARALALALCVLGAVAFLGWLAFGRRAQSGHASKDSTCDARLSFTPDPPVAGSALRVVYAHGQPLKYVDLKVTAAAYPGVRLEDLALEDRANWSWEVTALEPGSYRFEVWGGKPSERVAVCDKQVESAR